MICCWFGFGSNPALDFDRKEKRTGTATFVRRMLPFRSCYWDSDERTILLCENLTDTDGIGILAAWKLQALLCFLSLRAFGKSTLSNNGTTGRALNVKDDQERMARKGLGREAGFFLSFLFGNFLGAWDVLVA